MATKEEHLGRETAAFLKPRGSIGHGEATLLLRLSDVLAERDDWKAKHDLLAEFGHLAQGNCDTALAERDAAREELERLKSDVAEPAEAPVAEPAAQPRLKVGDLVRSKPSAAWHPFQGRVESITGPLGVATVALEPGAGRCTTSIKNLELVAEPAAPLVSVPRVSLPEPAAQEGPFDEHRTDVRENGVLVACCGYRDKAQRIAALCNAGLSAESRALTAAARARDAIVKRFESAGIEYPKSGSPDEAAEAVIAQAVRHVKRVAELESIAEDQESKLADLDRTCAHQKSRIESAERLVADLRSQLRTFAWVPPMPERMIPLDQETLKWSVLAGHCADLRAGIAIPDRESEEWREGLAAARERIAKAEAEERASSAGEAS